MQRRMFGAAALVTGLVAGVSMAIGVRRRRSHRDELLPIDPGPPLSAALAGATSDGATSYTKAAAATETAVDAAPAKPRRRRQHRKPAAASMAEAAESAPDAAAATTTSGDAGEPGAPAKPRRRRRRPATAAAADPGPGDVADAS